MKPKTGLQESVGRSGRASGLAGWSAVEDYMQGYDGSITKDYSDDVDTLLVFAGLFSAALSAFLVISFALLQIDNLQAAVSLLTRITLQLDNPSPGNSALPMPDINSFRPTRASLWVNSLWFVSLVLSLAAAFFGILVKQWLREYMRWNSPLCDPKENVLVRQIRFEAWQDWGVDTTIIYIPLLLELSLVLFFAGLEILLWSVESVVAIVVTIFISLFFGCAAAATILPLFIKRCPYKSPTTYGILLLYHLGKTYLKNLVNNVKRVSRMRSTQLWEDGSRPLRKALDIRLDWRTRDIQASHLRVLVDSDDREADAHTTFSNKLQVHFRGDTSEMHGALLEMGKAETLLRALSWVSHASQDKQVLANVASSAEFLHAVDLPYDIRYLSAVHLLSDRIGDSSPLPRESSDVSAWLPTLPDYALPGLDGTMFTLLEVLRRCYHMPETRTRRVGGHLSVSPHQAFGFLERTWNAKSDWFCTRQDFHIFLRLLVGDVKGTIFELVRLAMSRGAHVEPLAVGCRAMGLLCAFHRLIRAAQFKWPELQVELLEEAFTPLIDSYNALVGDARADCIDEVWCPGLRTSLLVTIYRFIDVYCDASGRLVLGEERRWPLENLPPSVVMANLVVTYRNSMLGRPYGREDCSCLVALTNGFLNSLASAEIAPETDWLTTNSDQVHTVVNIMISVAQTSLERSYTNCGSYAKLPWLSTFTLRNFWLIAPEQLGHLLDIMEKCDESGLLTEDVKAKLAHARGIVAYFEADPEQVWDEDLIHISQDQADSGAPSQGPESPSSDVIPTSGDSISTFQTGSGTIFSASS